VTIALEHIQPDDWAAVNRVTDTLRSLVIDTGGRSIGIRIGSGAATWTASINAAPVSVSHGLGRIPALAAAFPQAGGLGYEIPATSLTSTTMTVQGFTTAANVITLAASPFYWVVIG
jgi:hypothetical protein